MKITIVFINFLICQIVLLTHRMQFWKPCLKFFSRSPKGFCSKSEKKQKSIFFQKFSKNFISDWLNTPLKTLPKNFGQKPENVLLRIRNLIKRNKSEKVYFLKMLPPTVTIQFRKPCRNFFCQTSENFLLKIGIYFDKNNLKKHLPEVSFWQVEYSLDKTAGNVPAKWPQKICQISKVIQKDELFRKKISANCSSRQVDCSFDGSAKNFFE